jgi:hypothetical protein
MFPTSSGSDDPDALDEKDWTAWRGSATGVGVVRLRASKAPPASAMGLEVDRVDHLDVALSPPRC